VPDWRREGWEWKSTVETGSFSAFRPVNAVSRGEDTFRLPPPPDVLANHEKRCKRHRLKTIAITKSREYTVLLPYKAGT